MKLDVNDLDADNKLDIDWDAVNEDNNDLREDDNLE